jgi:hypothetical protein
VTRWRPWLEVGVMGLIGGLALLGAWHAVASWLGWSVCLCPPTP